MPPLLLRFYAIEFDMSAFVMIAGYVVGFLVTAISVWAALSDRGATVLADTGLLVAGLILVALSAILGELRRRR